MRKQQEIIRKQVNKALLKIEVGGGVGVCSKTTWKTDYLCFQVGKKEANSHSEEFVNLIYTVSSSYLSLDISIYK